MKDGYDACSTGMKELQSFGYITVEQVRNSVGQFVRNEYTVYEIPQLNESTQANESTSPKSKQEKILSGKETNGAITGKYQIGSIGNKSTLGNPLNGSTAIKSTSAKTKNGLSTRGNTAHNNIDSNNNDSTNTITTINDSVKKIISYWEDVFKVVVDTSEKKKLNIAIKSAIEKHGIEELKKAIYYRSQSDFYINDYPHLRDKPKSFFKYPDTIENDLKRAPFYYITYDEKVNKESQGISINYETDHSKHDGQGRPMYKVWR
jgi:hypothetical protein